MSRSVTQCDVESFSSGMWQFGDVRSYVMLYCFAVVIAVPPQVHHEHGHVAPWSFWITQLTDVSRVCTRLQDSGAFVGFFCISSKPYTTISHGAQGMACSRRSRRLGPDHSWTPAEISPVASTSQPRQSADHGQSRQQPKPSPPVAKTSGIRPFGDPSVKITAAQERVTKLESALAAPDGVEGPEVDSLRTALKRAKEVKLLPLDVQVKECEGFLSRARAHLTELDAKRATVSANIQDAERRLEAMKIQQQSAPPPPPQDADSELRQLRETVAQLKGSLHLTKPAVTLECPNSKRQCRREDFVPNCLEELQEWIRGRQTDLQDAMAAGRPDEVARISDIMCQAAQQWQREVAVGVMPSMVTNSVC